MNKFKYLVMIDLDELIVPYKQDTLTELIAGDKQQYLKLMTVFIKAMGTTNHSCFYNYNLKIQLNITLCLISAYMFSNIAKGTTDPSVEFSLSKSLVYVISMFIKFKKKS